jgi:hypothetical protein
VLRVQRDRGAAVAQRHRELHARGAGAGDRHAVEPHRRELVEEGLERLGGHRETGAGNGALDERADVERHKVVLELARVLQHREPHLVVELGHLPLDEFRPGRLGEAREVDLRLVAPVVPRDDAGQHARVDLPAARRDERKARSLQRLARERAQHGEVRVPGADEQDALHAPRASSRLRSSLRCTLPVVVMGSASMNSISRGYS